MTAADKRLDVILSEYRVAFHRYRSLREEACLRTAYEIGRKAVSEQFNLLELVEVHHCVVFAALRGSADGEFDDIAAAASQFLAEVLAPFEMTARGYVDHAREHGHAPAASSSRGTVA